MKQCLYISALILLFIFLFQDVSLAQDPIVDSLGRLNQKEVESQLFEQEQQALKNALMQEQLENQRLVIAISIISFAALLIFSIFISSRLRQTKKQKATIQLQKYQVEQSEKFKDQFLANMSHEIRTPMHAISGMLQILMRNEHSEFQAPLLDAMQGSTENLIVILNDILDLSKIEVGKLDIDRISMSPHSVVEDVHQILKVKADAKNLNFEYLIDKSVPPLILGDPVRLNQILTNLADNAIKFTKTGFVNIRVQNMGDNLRYTIKDSGIGIPANQLDLIFRAFVQADTSHTKTHGGTGLGLSISKQLVQLQSGKIWAVSQAGKGSTFYVEIPLQLPKLQSKLDSGQGGKKVEQMAELLSGVRILLVEDHEFNQMIACDDLRYFIDQPQIEIAENGKIALEMIEQTLVPYDLILMDIQMPKLDGFQTTKQIREMNHGSDIPIIAMTASILQNDIEKCYAVGMNNYISKPYQPKNLIRIIYETLHPPTI